MTWTNLRHGVVPGGEDADGQRAAGELGMALDHRFHLRDFCRIRQFSQRDHLLVAALGEVALLVEDVGDPARHARGEVAPGRPSTTTRPPVMYSQPWSPTPSTTASTPLLRTQKRSPATPRR